MMTDQTFAERLEALIAKCGVYKPYAIELRPLEDVAYMHTPAYDSDGAIDGTDKRTVRIVHPYTSTRRER